ncbi:hypothetical protein F0919_01995 [Taibaiella lutea]|uniref:Uncharacterized protein n=1 Tax=Taibaiella lutea TaxID=2608001 RepID=A0A5M6CR80_9BACT|nr:hypothetical protein [Taibaiella lutea]KAA5536462.1 hypothetical protein F0919_01995 [Taibaiella lutea]
MEQNLLKRATDFLESIGIKVFYQSLKEDTFLPGLAIDKGCIYIDLDKLKQPGDILHEAGHIAVVPAIERTGLTADTIGSRKENIAEEMMAIAWSYAACKYLEIDPYFVFHEEGYNGGGNYIADQFNQGSYFGVPMLQYVGMTAEAKMSAKLNMPAYPAMSKWLRE